MFVYFSRSKFSSSRKISLVEFPSFHLTKYQSLIKYISVNPQRMIEIIFIGNNFPRNKKKKMYED